MRDAFEKSESLVSMMRHNFAHFKPGLIIAVLRSIVVAPLPLLFGVIIDEYVTSGSHEGIAVMVLLCAGLLALHYAFAIMGCRLLAGETMDWVSQMRVQIFNKMQFLSFGYLDQNTTGKLISKYIMDTQRIQEVCLSILNQLIPNMIHGLSVLVLLVFLDWQLSFIILLLFPIIHFARVYFFNELQRQNHTVRLAQEQLTGKVNELISALRLVRSLGQERKAEEQLSLNNNEMMRKRFELVNFNSIFGTVMFCTNQAISIIVVAGGALLVIEGVMTLGTLVAFVSGLSMILMPINLFTTFSEQYFTGNESYNSIRELVTSNYVESWKGTQKLPEMRGEIIFDSVHFAYPTKLDEPVLTDFNLKVRAGESIALVGPSGSGKSTIASLTLGLYEPQKGNVCIDGVPHSALDMRDFRRHCAVVMQENLLLSGSIRDNIRFAKEDATEEEITAAARSANAEEFILKLPRGYDTVVGERGAQLSGGQRQRLSIARALLRNPKVLILDEATSALDNESERLIQEALERLARGRTVITIAHRLSTVRNADRIIVLREGKIIEQGSFEHLAQHGEHFQELLRSQLTSLQIVGVTPAPKAQTDKNDQPQSRRSA